MECIFFLNLWSEPLYQTLSNSWNMYIKENLSIHIFVMGLSLLCESDWVSGSMDLMNGRISELGTIVSWQSKIGRILTSIRFSNILLNVGRYSNVKINRYPLTGVILKLIDLTLHWIEITRTPVPYLRVVVFLYVFYIFFTIKMHYSNLTVFLFCFWFLWHIWTCV